MEGGGEKGEGEGEGGVMVEGRSSGTLGVRVNGMDKTT